MSNTTTIAVDAHLKKRFSDACKKPFGLTDREAVEILLKFIVDFGVNPEDLASLWKNNPKRDLANYHNYTVGFLKTFEVNQNENRQKFEKTQLNLLKQLLDLLKLLLKKNAIEKEVQNEILFNVQIIAGLINPKMGEKIIARNNERILKKEQEINK